MDLNEECKLYCSNFWCDYSTFGFIGQQLCCDSCGSKLIKEDNNGYKSESEHEDSNAYVGAESN